MSDELVGAHIIGLGANTPIGRNVWSSAAAARAGICGFSEHPFMVDSAGQPMRIASAPWLGLDLETPERYRELLLPTIDEALWSVDPSAPRHPMKVNLALGLPPARPGRPPKLDTFLLRSISEHYADVFEATATFELGHAAGCVALDAAIRILNARSADACLVAGVDSYVAAETLEWIEEADQLHGAGALNNAWGFIPGEAASALLLATETFAEAHRMEVYGEVVSVGLGREPHLIKTDAVCLGEGLTQAFHGALAPLSPDETIHNVICDLNGETYRADEYGFTALRMKERFSAAADFVAPADCWGDVGAAGTPLHVALAVIAHRKRYSKGSLSMVWASSEGGERGAAVVRAAALARE